MKKRSLQTLSLAVALAFPVGYAAAQSSGTSASGAAGSGSSMTGGQAAPAAQPGTGTRDAETRKDDQLSRGDRKFLQEAAESGMFEMEAAQLASTKATDPQVKSYASKLVDAHSTANNELVQIANAKKVELPAAAPRDKRKDVEKLGKLSGDEFDQRFVRDVGVKAHEKNIRKFEEASKDVKDPELKAWVDKTLPHLREHLAMAKQLPQAEGRGTAAMGASGRDADSDRSTRGSSALESGNTDRSSTERSSAGTSSGGTGGGDGAGSYGSGR